MHPTPSRHPSPVTRHSLPKRRNYQSLFLSQFLVSANVVYSFTINSTEISILLSGLFLDRVTRYWQVWIGFPRLRELASWLEVSSMTPSAQAAETLWGYIKRSEDKQLRLYTERLLPCLIGWRNVNVASSSVEETGLCAVLDWVTFCAWKLH